MAGPLSAALGGAGPVTAPVPPGALGQASSAQELLTYLSELQVWLDLRRGELDRLDSAAQQAKDSASFTSDVVLAMSMWQSVSTSMLDLTRLWDSGRADALARAAGWQALGGCPLFRLYDTPDAALAQMRLAGHQIWSRIFPYSNRWLRLGLPGGETEWARFAQALAV